MASDSTPRCREEDYLPLLENVSDPPNEGIQSVHQYPLPEMQLGSEALVTGNEDRDGAAIPKQRVGTEEAPQEPATGNSTSTDGRSIQYKNKGVQVKPQAKRKAARIICSIVIIIISLILFLLSIGCCIGGGILFQMKSSDSEESTKQYIAYEGDTLFLAEVNEEYRKVSVQQLCSGGGGHTVQFYLAPNCDLKPHCFKVSSGTTLVNSTKSPTITEVRFSGQSHIYMTSRSNITFTVDISTPMADTSLVIFNNYTYFTDFEHSDPRSAKNALVFHMFKEQSSSFTFQGETNTYFAVFESLNNINFTFHYSGHICNYSHLNYKQSECDLPASACEQKRCTFKYPPHNKTCILGYVPQGVTRPTFTYLRIETYRRTTTNKQKNTGIALLSVGLFLAVFVAVWFLWPSLLYI